MTKSLLDIVHPHPKYNFRPYWHDSYYMIQHLIGILRQEERDIREKNVTSGVNERGNPYISFDSDEAIARLQHLNAEIKYMERLIRIRRFWRPRDWSIAIVDSFISVFDKIKHHFDRRKAKRIANMTEEKRIAYYRKRIKSLEKKIISIYDKAQGCDNDCSFIPARYLGNDRELKERLEPLLLKRRFILDTIFQASPVEVKRLTEINNLLRQHVDYMKKQLSEYYSANVNYLRGKDLDGSIEASLSAYPLLHESHPGDDFYGSNFNKILDIEYELMSGDALEACETLRIFPDENPNYDANNLVIRGYESYRDNEDWKECWEHVVALKDIKFCHALHHMWDHQELPLVDILHKTSFDIEIKHELYFDKEKINYKNEDTTHCP